MNPAQIIAMVKRLQAAGLLYPGEGTVTEWSRHFADTDPNLAYDACTDLIANTVRGPITIAAVLAKVKTLAEEAALAAAPPPPTPPDRFRCLEHPEHQAHACPECRSAIESPEARARAEQARAEVRALAQELARTHSVQEQERLERIQRRADESAARAREKLEKQRQLTEYEASDHPGGGFSASEENP